VETLGSAVLHHLGRFLSGQATALSALGRQAVLAENAWWHGGNVRLSISSSG